MLDLERLLPTLGALALLVPAALAQGDTCSTATPITGTGAWGFDNYPMTTSGFDGGNPASCFSPTNTTDADGEIGHDVFYVWTVPADGSYDVFSTGTGFADPKISVHAGTDCNATCIASDSAFTPFFDARITLPGLVAGDQYLIQMGSWVDNGPRGSGQLNIDLTPPPPTNDTCATPLVVNGLVSVPFDTTWASTSQFNAGGPCYGNGFLDLVQDVFFEFTAPATGGYQVNDLGTQFATRMNLYSGTGCNATCIDWTQGGGPGGSTGLQFQANAGDVFMIQVGGTHNSATGAGVLNFTTWNDPCLNQQPDAFEPNNDCSQAAPLPLGTHNGLNIRMTDLDYYSVTVDPQDVLTVQLTYDPTNAEVIAFLYPEASCTDVWSENCIPAAVDCSWSGSGYEELTYANATASPVDLILRVRVNPTSPIHCNDYDLVASLNGASAGQLFCDPAAVNSSGNYVTLEDSSPTGPGLYHLHAEGGPPSQFGYFLVSATAVDPGVAVSGGFLCLGTPQGRYNGLSGINSLGQFDGQGVFQSIAGGSSVGSGFDIPISVPFPPGGVITPGSTWHFQLWYRDQVGSNFSNGVTLDFP